MAGKHEYLWSLTLDSDGARLWTVGNERRVECRSVPDGTVVWSIPLPAVAGSLCVIPKTQTLAVALENGDLQIHDANSGALLRRVPSGSAAIQSITATPDGLRLIGGGVEGDLHVIDAASGSYLASIPVRDVAPLHHVTMRNDGTTVAALGKSGLLRAIHAR